MGIMAAKTKDKSDRGKRQPRRSPGLWAGMRANFLTGLIVVTPIVLTLYLTWAFITFVDAKVVPLVPAPYNPRTYINADIPGFGLVIFLIFTTIVGYFAKRVFGMQLIRLGESIVSRMPVVRTIYKALKQIVETVLSQTQTSFRQACLVEYPRPGLWAIAFVATETTGEIVEKRGGEEMVSVFLPTTPNPTSGFLLFVPKKDIILLEMTIEEAAKLIISAGLVVPPTKAEREAAARNTEAHKRAIARAAGARNGIPKV
jgi:uncharacterized membrane protein